MKPGQQQIALAELCGKRYPSGVGPDYLNAVHEAEKVLTPQQKATRNIHLWRIITGSQEAWDIPDNYGISLLIDATAPQRCEALLRATGKWVEE